MFFQNFLCFINFRSQVRAPAPIRMIKKHELPMVFSNFVFSQSALAMQVKESVTRIAQQAQESESLVPQL